ncbi:MAG TPA: hypothetical protein VJR94_00045 [Candidatus Nitrosocosmicus sp.]|nr:hypothetical protein [Candidatus Nitrosocosmicus sp.]
MDRLEDLYESLVTTFWKTKEDMADSIRQIIIFYLMWMKNSNQFLKSYQKEVIR